jgi:hypothetical protein
MWSWAPDGCLTSRQTGWLTVGRNITLTLTLTWDLVSQIEGQWPVVRPPSLPSYRRLHLKKNRSLERTRIWSWVQTGSEIKNDSTGEGQKQLPDRTWESVNESRRLVWDGCHPGSWLRFNSWNNELVVRQSRNSMDVNTEAEDVTALEAVTRRQPVKIQQTE